jgi:tryptophan 7-halogenase
VAVGLSSGFLEPLESTSIYLIQRAVIRLLQLFPGAGITPADVAEFNQQTRADIEHIRDFIVLHYHVTNRRDAPYWQACHSMAIPATLQHRIDLFRETGRVFRTGGELFSENSWVQVMLGQGLVPRQHHAAAHLMGDAELARFLDGIRADVDQAVARMPAHQAYVERYVGATATPGATR